MGDMTRAQDHLHKFLLTLPQDPILAQTAIYELIRVVIDEEREACAKVAEKVAGYYSANNGDNKDVALLVAQEIRSRK